MRKLLRTLLDSLTAPVWQLAFFVIPMRWLAYLAGFSYGRDAQHPAFNRALLSLLGRHNRHAAKVMNVRLKRLPVEQRRLQARHLWCAPTTLGWGSRAFDDPAGRCGNYVYTAILHLHQALGRPLSVLELGCTSGGSLHCLIWRGVALNRYCGVDIARRAVEEARRRFPDAAAHFQFICEDFIAFCERTRETFDVLLVKQTFLFLDQDYLERLLACIAHKGIATRIVLHERQLRSHSTEDSLPGVWGNVPLDYSHNYVGQFQKIGYRVESGGLTDHPSVSDTLLVKAVMVYSDAEAQAAELNAERL